MPLPNLKNNKGIFAIVLIFFALKILTISMYKVIWWDASVYLGMGKYIFSFGNAGLWEYTRPVVWPIILGFFWKIGLDNVFVGRIIEVAFGGLCILLTYKIAEKLFGRKTALLSALFLAVSPTFFFFNGVMLTEIVSVFFALLGIYLFLNKKYFISGMLLGTTFLTRFLQLIVFISLILIMAFYLNKKNIRNLLKVIAGFAIVLLPYLILNQILYNNFLFPFIQHITITKNSGWLNYQPLSYYFLELFKENIFYLLSILGIILVFRGKDANKKIIASIFLTAFIFFSSIKQKEMRFLIILMPFMYILVSSSIFYLYGMSVNRKAISEHAQKPKVFDRFRNIFYKNIFAVLVVLSLIFSAYNSYLLYQEEFLKPNPYAELETRFKDAHGMILVSNPVIAALGDKKVELMYYPFFSKDKKTELIEKTANADFVFLDLCDLGCRPGDTECEKEKDSLLLSLKQNLKTAYSSKNGGCWQYIFRK